MSSACPFYMQPPYAHVCLCGVSRWLKGEALSLPPLYLATPLMLLPQSLRAVVGGVLVTLLGSPSERPLKAWSSFALTALLGNGREAGRPVGGAPAAHLRLAVTSPASFPRGGGESGRG